MQKRKTSEKDAGNPPHGRIVSPRTDHTTDSAGGAPRHRRPRGEPARGVIGTFRREGGGVRF